MIVITGTSGHLGRLVVDRLVDHIDPATIVATARSTEKLADLADRGVTVRRLDYDDPTSIVAALDGATQVLLISSSEFGRRVEQHTAVIEAAAAAGVQHLAYTSLLGADRSPLIAAQDHAGTERVLADSPLTTTRLRNGWYLENYTENLGPALANGAFIGAAGDGRIAAAARADYAAAAVAVLTDESRWGGTYELAGPSFTMADLGATVSAATGRTLPYVDLPAAELEAAYGQAGLPAPMVQFLVDADLGIAAGHLDAPSATLEELVGTPLVSLEERVRAALEAEVTSG